MTQPTEHLYDALVEDDDARVCADIPEEACREVPRNFFLYVASLTLTKVGDAVASPKTTLAWVMSAVGAPPSLVGLLVPLRESGSMLPQLLIAGAIRRRRVRKGVWVLGSVLQAVALLAAAAAATFSTGAVAGWAILGAVALFALSRSLASVASKDVKGKTIPKTRRGRASGLASSVSGVLTLGVGLALLLRGQDAPASFYGGLLAAAAGLWLLAAVLFSRIDEQPGATEGEEEGWRETVGRLSLLGSDAPFRRFVLTRALLVSTALAAPYYVLLARERVGGEVSLLALFILASGLASSLSATPWGRFADRSSRRVLIAAAFLASTLGAAVFVAVRLAPELTASRWFFAAAFFVLGVAHSGVRQGRKTYVVDMATGNRRTDYVAVSNTAIALVLLASSALGPLVDLLTPAGMLLGLAVLGYAGAALAFGLEEVQAGT